jgi:N-acetylglucosamine malate deacetylase 1
MKKIFTPFLFVLALSHPTHCSTATPQRQQPLQILVFSPHPDDDVIGCGGSIAKYIKHGHKVAIIYMTSGTALAAAGMATKLGVIREQEATEAAKTLGVTDLTFLRQQDYALSYSEPLVTTLRGLIEKIKPDRIYMPTTNDEHKDHVATHQLVRAALTQIKSNSIVLCYEVWPPLQRTDHKEDITDCMDLKMAALGKHMSQLGKKRFDLAIKALNNYRGIMTGYGTYCECFELLK